MRWRDPFTIVAILTIVLLSVVLAISLTENERSGTLEITVTGTRGVMLGHLGGGRVIEGDYQSDAPLNVYLMNADEAESFRNPSYYDNEFSFPATLSSGQNGSFKVRIGSSGSYELLFWNESFNRNHEVQYTIDTGMRIRETPFITSIVSLSLMSSVLLTIAYLRGRRKGQNPT